MVLDTHIEVFIWIGQHANSKLKQQSFDIGQVRVCFDSLEVNSVLKVMNSYLTNGKLKLVSNAVKIKLQIKLMTQGTVQTVVFSTIENVTFSRLSLVGWLFGFYISILTSSVYTMHMPHFNIDLVTVNW